MRYPLLLTNDIVTGLFYSGCRDLLYIQYTVHSAIIFSVLSTHYCVQLLVYIKTLPPSHRIWHKQKQI